jgi:pilus assembly protein CpaC
MIRLSTGLSRVSAALILALVILFCGAVNTYASKEDPLALEAETDPIVVLRRGMAEIVDVPGNVADILVADPSLVDVMALQSNRLYIVGVNYGTTNVMAVDAGGNVLRRLNVHVKIDDLAIQNTVERLFPNEHVEVTATADQVILTGYVSTPDVAQSVTNLVAQYVGEVQDRGGSADELIVNLLKVSGEQQVMLKVKVIEASRDVLREFGVETNYEEEGGIANLTGQLLADAGAGLTADPLGIANVIYNTGANGFGPLQVIIRALESNGLVNTLAEPNLTAISGEQAGFLAGGEFPVPSARDQDGNIIVTYRPFGVALNFKPNVLSGDRINLQLETEVSTISNQNSISVNGLEIPAFAVRRAETTVELASGGSLMIAGLLQSDVTKGLTQLPGIGNVPIIGDLLKSDSFQRQESELVIIVTAYLVKPYADPENHAEISAPETISNPLAKAFAKNIQHTYAKMQLDPALFDDNNYGYLLE